MGWYALISLLTDGRIRFLLAFVVFAIIFAIILIIVEMNMREKVRAQKEKLRLRPEDRIRIFIESNKTISDKLEFIDKMAKEYFAAMYNFPLTVSYSSLLDEFKKKNHVKEAAFCKEMFLIFYSNSTVDDNKIREIGRMLMSLERVRTAEEIKSDKKQTQVPTQKETQKPIESKHVETQKSSLTKPNLAKENKEDKIKRKLQEQLAIANESKNQDLIKSAPSPIKQSNPKIGLFQKIKKDFEKQEKEKEKKSLEKEEKKLKLKEEKKVLTKKSEKAKPLPEIKMKDIPSPSLKSNKRFSRDSKKADIKESKESIEKFKLMDENKIRKEREELERKKKFEVLKIKEEKENRKKSKQEEKLKRKQFKEEQKRRAELDRLEAKRRKEEQKRKKKIGIGLSDMQQTGTGFASRIIREEKERLEGEII